MSDIIQDAKRLLDGATPGPWRAADSDIISEDGNRFIATVSEYSGLDEPSEEYANVQLIAVAPELAQALAEESYEYIAEWCDHGVWAPIEMEMFDGTFPNLQAARGYIKVAKTRGPYEDTRIVRRRVSPVEVCCQS